MKQRSLYLVLITILSFQPVPAQQPKASPPQKQERPPDDVVRVTTNLVQVDVVVLDKDGRQVTNLRPEDFEVSEDGKRKPIMNFLYVAADEGRTTESKPSDEAPPADKDIPSGPGMGIRAEELRRTIAFVVDDLGLSFESIGFVRESLKKFVEEQMQPGDQVAIIRTSGSVGVLQQVTTNKQQLSSAIEQIKYYPMGRNGTSPFQVSTGAVSQDALMEGGREKADFEEFRQDIFAVGTIGILDYVVSGLGDLPGRKAVMLVSEGFKIHTSQGRSERVLDAIKRLADQCNRASAVVYTIDVRGLQPLTMSATDRPFINPYAGDIENLPPIGAGPAATANRPKRLKSDSARVTIATNSERAELDSVAAFRQLDSLMNQRNAEFFESQSVLSYLAQQTGGLYLQNHNNLASGIQRLMEDQKGYYLIGYRPDESTIDVSTGRRRPLKVSVKVKGSGLTVRTRSGFYGVSHANPVRNKGNREQQLSTALISPFASGDIKLNLTSLLDDDPMTGPFIRSMLHVNARDLSFTKKADGSHKAEIDVLIAILGDNGNIVGQPPISTQPIEVNGNAFEQVLRDGLVYIFNVPIKQPGPYQLRVAVRDTKSEHVGGAGQFIDIPNLVHNQLVLSGILLFGTKNVSIQSATTGAEQSVADQDMQSSPAVRRLRQGMTLNYRYTIYKAQIDRETNRPQLQTQMRLFKDGRLVFTGKLLPYDAGQQVDLKRLNVAGRIRVGHDLVPGSYMLQIIVKDLLVKDKSRSATATQIIDFEVVK